MIDQTTLGHAALLDLFNVTPRVAWQIGVCRCRRARAVVLC
jgi:hypothetical protein